MCASDLCCSCASGMHQFKAAAIDALPTAGGMFVSNESNSEMRTTLGELRGAQLRRFRLTTSNQLLRRAVLQDRLNLSKRRVRLQRARLHCSRQTSRGVAL